MKTLVLLLFLAPAAWGQDTRAVWDTLIVWTTDNSSEEVQDSLYRDGIVREMVRVFLPIWQEYKDSCWADSTVTSWTGYRCDVDTCWCNDPNGFMVHFINYYGHLHQPDATEFIEFLRRRYK